MQTETNTNKTENKVKLARDKSGKFVRADKVTKTRKDRTEGLKLTCTITGKSRPTNHKYLDAKADRLGVTVKDLMENYVSKEGLAQLTEENPRYQELMKMNGKLRANKEKAQKEELKKAA